MQQAGLLLPAAAANFFFGNLSAYGTTLTTLFRFQLSLFRISKRVSTRTIEFQPGNHLNQRSDFLPALPSTEFYLIFGMILSKYC